MAKTALQRAILTASLALLSAAAQAQAPASASPVKELLIRPLEGIAGKEGMMLTVDLAPGNSSAAHRHNAHTFVYVLEGRVEMQVAGGEAKVLGPGETFYESPEDVHVVSRNTSMTEPARILVLLVKDIGAPVTVPAN